jgi:hypothetical protein
MLLASAIPDTDTWRTQDTIFENTETGTEPIQQYCVPIAFTNSTNDRAGLLGD